MLSCTFFRSMRLPHLSIVNMHVSCGCTHAHARRQWTTLRVPRSGITEMRGVHGQRSEINRNASDWHGWSWLTRVTLTVGSSCCPPSLPPPCLTQLMSKLGSVQRSQCRAGENTMLSFFFFFGRSPSSYFCLPFYAHHKNGNNWHRRHKSYYYMALNEINIFTSHLLKELQLPFYQRGLMIVHLTSLPPWCPMFEKSKKHKWTLWKCPPP